MKRQTVVTGQQLGLFGGPLYTCYKILGCLKLAEKKKARAVYWLETNDADFQEIRSVNFLDKEHRLQGLSWDKESRGFSCGYLEVDAALQDMIDSYFKLLARTPHTEGLREMVSRAYRPGVTLGRATADFLKAVFADYPLEFFDPAGPDFRAFSQPILLKEAASTPPGGQCNLFFLDGYKRVAVFAVPGGFTGRRGNKLDLEKGVLLPNLMTRSLLQDAYLGASDYIAGPAEAVYLKKLKKQYKKYKVRPAFVTRRMSLTLLEPHVLAAAARTGISLRLVLKSNKVELEKLVKNKYYRYDFQKLSSQAREKTHRFTDGLKEAGLGVKELEKIIYRKLKEEIGLLRKREKERAAPMLKAASLAADSLYPAGKIQERGLNLLYFLNKYGPADFIRWLYTNYAFKKTVKEVDLAES